MPSIEISDDESAPDADAEFRPWAISCDDASRLLANLDAKLNDDILNGCLDLLSQPFTHSSLFVSSLVVQGHPENYPRFRNALLDAAKGAGSVRRLVLSINLNNAHWLLALLQLTPGNGKGVCATLYDSVRTSKHEEEAKKQISLFTTRVLQRGGVDFAIGNCPQQPDAVSCGVYVIYTGAHLLTDTPLQQLDDISLWRPLASYLCTVSGSWSLSDTQDEAFCRSYRAASPESITSLAHYVKEVQKQVAESSYYVDSYIAALDDAASVFDRLDAFVQPAIFWNEEEISRKKRAHEHGDAVFSSVGSYSLAAQPEARELHLNALRKSQAHLKYEQSKLRRRSEELRSLAARLARGREAIGDAKKRAQDLLKAAWTRR